MIKPEYVANAMFQWYTKPEVKFQLIKHTQGREFALLVAKGYPHPERSTRYGRVHRVQDLDYFLWKRTRCMVKVRYTATNLYYSLAVYDGGMPFNNGFQPLDKAKWTREAHTKMTEYDFLLDIDAGDHTEMGLARLSAIVIIDQFNKHDVPYKLRFSGKGFHILIPYRYFGHLNRSFVPLSQNSIYRLYAQIARALHDEHSQMIDLAIYDSRRVVKLPFSLAIYPDEIYVCTPIDGLKGLKGFRIDEHTPGKLRGRFPIKGYNEPVHNLGGNIGYLLEIAKEKERGVENEQTETVAK